METMYYPSRIRQLVDEPDGQLEAIDELAIYYKELYQILSQQAMSQIEAVETCVASCGYHDIGEPCKTDDSL